MSRRVRPTFRPPPTTLCDGVYAIHECIGRGGMASVYRATDVRDQSMWAVKILNERAGARSKMRSRFLNEAKTMQSLDHPNIVRVREVGEEDDHYFFVMQLAREGALSARLRRMGFLDLDIALSVATQVLAGLQRAHEAGVVHRDIKPQNVLLDMGERVLLTDFGIARMLANAGNMGITGTGDMLGTIAYMAPEQRLDPRKVTPASDLYSVGAMLYLMLTGRRPLELVMGRLDPGVFERVPPPLRPLIRRATAHLAQDRYATAQSMSEDLERCSVGLEAVAPEPPPVVVHEMPSFNMADDTTAANTVGPDDPTLPE